MEETLKQILGKIDSMDKRFDAMDKRFDFVDQRLAALETGQRELKTEVGEVKTDVKELSRKLDAVYEQTAGRSEFRTQVADTIGVSRENQKSLTAIVGEHEVQIRSLQRKKA